MPRAKGGSIPPPRVMIHPGQGGPISDLNEHDVLSGRGGRINNHPGNITFRTVVEDYKREYLDPRTRKLEKAHVAARLVSQIRSTNPPGRFLREDPVNPGCYVEIGDTKAWKKAGQALREDAPDVRKEIDEDIETTIPEKPVSDPNYASPLQQQQPAYHQQHQYRPGVPPGIPPSVSYSPTSAPMPLAPPSSGGARPDPPEAVGVTGYRQPPLRYFSGRGRGGGASGRGFPDRRGRGPPPPPSLHHPQQQQQHQQQFPVQQPQQGYHHHQNYYNHPPQPGIALAPLQHYPPPGPQFQQHPPPPFQQPPYQHHHPQQYPPHIQHPNQQPPGYNNGPLPPQPHPQFTAPPQDNGKKQPKKKSSSPIPPLIAPAANAVAHGIHQTMDAMNGFTNRVTKRRPAVSSSRGSAESEFPPHMSIATDFTMSDISAMGESRNGFSGVFDESMRASIPPPAAQKLQGQGATDQAAGPTAVTAGGGTAAHLKQSTGTTSSSSKSRDNSLTMSDLMGSGFSLGMSGRTRSFPDLMLSTNDLLPPLHSDFGDSEREEKEQRRPPERNMLRPFHRQSSSESSEMGGFHPVRERNNTGNISGLNDAMSIMSLDSRKSIKSETSSWLENFRSMQSIHSDMNPWEAGGSGVSGGGMGMSLVRNQMNDGSDNGSVRSFLSDVSTELNALDLAEPLLPPIPTDSPLNDSGSDYMVARPDP